MLKTECFTITNSISRDKKTHYYSASEMKCSHRSVQHRSLIKFYRMIPQSVRPSVMYHLCIISNIDKRLQNFFISAIDIVFTLKTFENFNSVTSRYKRNILSFSQGTFLLDSSLP